jgi:hypothetical protein
VALSERGEDLGADQQAGDIGLVLRMVLSAETGHASRALDRVPPTRPDTPLGRDRGWRARVHDRRRPDLARPRSWWTVGHARARRSPQGSRHAARLGWRWVFRERRRRCHVALAEHGSRRRIPAQRSDRPGATGDRRDISRVRTVLRVRRWPLGRPVVSPSHARAVGARPRRLARTSQHNRTTALRRREGIIRLTSSPCSSRRRRHS